MSSLSGGLRSSPDRYDSIASFVLLLVYINVGSCELSDSIYVTATSANDSGNDCRWYRHFLGPSDHLFPPFFPLLSSFRTGNGQFSIRR